MRFKRKVYWFDVALAMIILLLFGVLAMQTSHSIKHKRAEAYPVLMWDEGPDTVERITAFEAYGLELFWVAEFKRTGEWHCVDSIDYYMELRHNMPLLKPRNGLDSLGISTFMGGNDVKYY